MDLLHRPDLGFWVWPLDLWDLVSPPLVDFVIERTLHKIVNFRHQKHNENLRTLKLVAFYERA